MNEPDIVSLIKLTLLLSNIISKYECSLNKVRVSILDNLSSSEIFSPLAFVKGLFVSRL